MRAKHTPGPYFASEDNESCECHSNSGLAIIDTGRTNDFPIAHHVEWNNVPLIIAAPDLLEELKNMVTQYGCECGHPACKRCEDSNAARAAIAKADG